MGIVPIVYNPYFTHESYVLPTTPAFLIEGMAIERSAGQMAD